MVVIYLCFSNCIRALFVAGSNANLFNQRKICSSMKMTRRTQDTETEINSYFLRLFNG
jgi:hypothetical protein